MMKMKKRMGVVVLTFLLAGCVQTPSLPETPEPRTTSLAKVQVETRAPLLWKQASQVNEALVNWMDEDWTLHTLSGYEIVNPEILWDNYPEEQLLKALADWEVNNMNRADGLGESILGYQKDSLVCILHKKTLISPEEMRDSDSDISNVPHYLALQCAEWTPREKKADRPTTEDLAFQAFGAEPFWELTLKGEQIVFTSPETEETHQVTLQKQGEDLSFTAANIQGKITKKTCQDDSIGEMHPYSISFTREGDMLYQGCAAPLPLKIQNPFFVIGEEWPIQELIDQTFELLQEGEKKEEITYRIDDIQWPYAMIGIQYPMGWYALVLKETARWMESVWEGQDIDYETCKQLEKSDPELKVWEMFQNCSELLPQ